MRAVLIASDGGHHLRRRTRTRGVPVPPDARESERAHRPSYASVVAVLAAAELRPFGRAVAAATDVHRSKLCGPGDDRADRSRADARTPVDSALAARGPPTSPRRWPLEARGAGGLSLLASLLHRHAQLATAALGDLPLSGRTVRGAGRRGRGLSAGARGRVRTTWRVLAMRPTPVPELEQEDPVYKIRDRPRTTFVGLRRSGSTSMLMAAWVPVELNSDDPTVWEAGAACPNG